MPTPLNVLIGTDDKPTMKTTLWLVCFFGSLYCFGIGDQEERAIIVGKRQAHLLLLRRTKSSLLAGDFETAGKLLARVDATTGPASAIKRRYESLLLFLEGRHTESLDILAHRSFETPSQFRQICLQKIFSMAMSAHRDGFEAQLRRCSRLNRHTSKNQELWLSSLKRAFRDKTHLAQLLPQAISDTETLLVWMKSALFFGEEKTILANIEEFPPDIYDFPAFRELASLLFYRTGDFPLAERFAESINTPNADNIRGNIALMNRDYEGAFAHFQSALEKKPNSLNALRRLVPTAWITGRWLQGRGYLDLLPPDEGGGSARLLLESAFSIKLGRMEEAGRAIKKAKSLIGKDLPIPQEILLTHGYLSLMGARTEEFEESSSLACRRFDALNCWLTSQQLLREDLPTTLKREEPVHAKPFDIEKLKHKAQITGLQEEVFIDQEAIEALDGLP